MIATTHYSALKTYGADNEDILLSSVEFDMEKMLPTYRYIEGISGQSNAFEIARRYGLKESIIRFARERKEADRSKADIAMEKLEQSLMENYELKEKLAARLKDVRQLQADLEQEKNSWRSGGRKFWKRSERMPENSWSPLWRKHRISLMS